MRISFQLKYWQWVGFLLYITYLSASMVHAFKQPFYGWDVIAYTAAALSIEVTDPRQLQQETYEFAKVVLPPPVYAELRLPGYRQTVAENSDAFIQQLPFYYVRPLYNYAIYVLYQFGLNPLTAIQLISIFSSILLCLLILRWMTLYFPLHQSCLLAFLLIHVTGALQISAVLTPDALSALLLTVSFYWIVTRRMFLACVGLSSAIFVRNDNLLWALLTWIYLYRYAPLDYRINGKQGIVWMTLGLLGYTSVNYLSGSYGWAILVHHTFIQELAYPADFKVTIQWADYFSLWITQGLREWWIVNPICFFLFCSGLTLLYRSSSESLAILYKHCTVLALLAIGLHFFFFPALWHRFFVAHYVVIAISMVYIVISTVDD